MKPSHARRMIEKQYGSVRAGLLSELRTMSPPQLAEKWDVHYNTILAWMDQEGIERYVGYRVKEEALAGVAD